MLLLMMLSMMIALTLMQMEKRKCKLLDLEAQQSDDHDTSEGGDSCGPQTQVPHVTACATCDA